MAKIKYLPNIDQETGEPYHHPQFLYWCEGCQYEHAFALANQGGHHRFNRDLDNPTVSPSLVESYTDRVCHSYIIAGRIQYLHDCTHHLAGQTIELPDIEKKLMKRQAVSKTKRSLENNPGGKPFCCHINCEGDAKHHVQLTNNYEDYVHSCDDHLEWAKALANDPDSVQVLVVE